MIAQILFILFLCVAVFIESTFIPYPFVFILLALYFFYKETFLFFIMALFFGSILDQLTFQTVGATSLFLAVFLILMYFLRRAFAVFDIRIYLLCVFLASIIYGYYIGYPFTFSTVGISAGMFFMLGLLLVWGTKQDKVRKQHV